MCLVDGLMTLEMASVIVAAVTAMREGECILSCSHPELLAAASTIYQVEDNNIDKGAS